MHLENTHPGPMVARIVGMTILGLVGAVIIAFLFGYFVMLLWNWLLPPLFHAGAINYWQAIGLVILAKLLFGGSGMGHSYRGRRNWKREARRWDHWESGQGRHGWKGPWGCGDAEGDEWAPRGSHRNWRYYGQYWRDGGKAAYEAWLEKQDKTGDKGPDKGPDQPPAQ
jgi:hypothetical protein